MECLCQYLHGLFISNLIGTGALSAINLTAPVIQLVTAVSTMLATGGSAVVEKDGRAEDERGQGGFHIPDFGECAGRSGDVYAWVCPDGIRFQQNGTFFPLSVLWRAGY